MPSLLLLTVVVSLAGAVEYGVPVANPLPSHLLMPVHLGGGSLESRQKRQALTMDQPIRISLHYADNFDANLQFTKANLVRSEIMPRLLNFLRQALSVAPISGPILINNNCTTNSIIRNQDDGSTTCLAQCAPTFCGPMRVPTQHLKQCRQCNSATNRCGRASVGVPSQDGAGVTNADYILYVTAEQSACPSAGPGSQVVAFALACQTEATQDRPVAGAVNFCPDGLQGRDSEFAFALTKHEVLHALAFTRSLFSLWRNPTNNEPRTPRNQNSGLPNIDSQGLAIISQSTVETIEYSDWQTEAGIQRHTVRRLVTEAVRAEGQRHFNCPSLAGVELENQGGPGTELNHWEKRVLGNEAMTGQITFNPVFSRFTFAALEDSGWYQVNYSLADNFVWGLGAGCRFAEGSCREWINTQQNNNQYLVPFCNVLQSTANVQFSCTADHEAVSRCNLVQYTNALPSDYVYFSNPRIGGAVAIADYCPFQDVLQITTSDGNTRGTTCSNGNNMPPQSDNSVLESYGPGTRCVVHGSQWTIDGSPVRFGGGGGCYQYQCIADEVTITIASDSITCSCSEVGQQRPIDVTVNGKRYQGSIICPSCEVICLPPSKNIVSGIGTRIGTGGAISPHGIQFFTVFLSSIFILYSFST